MWRDLAHSLKSFMVLRALLVELTSLWEILAAASKLGLTPATQTCFPKANVSVRDPVLAPAHNLAFFLDSLVLPSLGYSFVSLALLHLAPYL